MDVTASRPFDTEKPTSLTAPGVPNMIALVQNTHQSGRKIALISFGRNTPLDRARLAHFCRLLLPTVPFLLLAAFCFARSNPVGSQATQCLVGSAAADWRGKTRHPAPGQKIAAIGAMSVGVGFAFTLGTPAGIYFAGRP
jgi:hypothetical protein